MANTVFQLRRNAVSGTRPTTLTVSSGELAINTTDGILFSANATSIFEIGGNLTSISVGNSTSRFFVVNTTVVAIGNSHFVANGNVGIGNTAPTVKLHITGTDAVLLPGGTTAQRPATANGMIRYNSNTRTIEAVANTTWTSLMAAYSSVREQFTASNNQTTFTVTGGYVAGQVDVYYNGVKLRNGSEINVSDGTTVVLATGAVNNALIEVVGIGPSFIISNTAQVLYQQFTATSNQSSFTVTGGYVPGLADVFIDGIKMVNGVDVNLSTGSTVDLTIPVPNGSLVEVKGYTTPLVSAQTSTAVRQTFIANSTVNNNFTVTGGYITGQLDAYYNGSKLVNGTDVNTSSGSTITLTSNAALGATIDVVGINYFAAGGGVTTPVRQSFTATANQTSFTITGGYTAGQIDVYQNGSKLSNVDDVNVSSGSAVVLAVGAAVSDVIEVVGFAATSYQDSVRKSGDTMSGPLNISANLTVTGTANITGNVTTSGTVTDGTGTIRPLVLDTAQTANGTSIDFTSIPSWARRVTVMLSGVSTNGSSNILVQLGSGSITTTGYNSQGVQTAPAAISPAISTIGLILTGVKNSAAIYAGACTITNITGNTWVASGTLAANTANNINYFGGSSPALAGVLDRLRLTTVNGTDAFDAGSVNIMYE